MPTVTRTVTGPVVGANGAVLVGATVQFGLSKPEADRITGELVAIGPYTATTDSSGQFSLALWPTDRGSRGATYTVTVTPSGGAAQRIRCGLIAGDLSSIKLADMVRTGEVLDPYPAGLVADLTAFLGSPAYATRAGALAALVGRTPRLVWVLADETDQGRENYYIWNGLVLRGPLVLYP